MRRSLLLLAAALALARGWRCVCDPAECEPLGPSGCPGRGYVVWDSCRCCKVCARTVGEECGGFRGTCEPALTCLEGVCAAVT